MRQVVDAYSRYVVSDANNNEHEFMFAFQFVAGLSRLDVYRNGVWIHPGDYELDGNTIDLEDKLDAGDTLEIVRMTPPPADGTPLSPLQILFMVQEAVDKQVFMNGHGLPLLKGNVTPNEIPESSLLTNIFETPGDEIVMPTVQALPDGRLAADPAGENPVGFSQAAFRTEHRVPAALPPLSHPMWWFSGVVENPESTAAVNNNFSYYGLKVTLKGYQEGRPPHHLANSAINVISTTAPGVQNGNSQAMVVEARHEAIQASYTFDGGAYKLRITAEGGEETRGELGNDLSVRIMTPSTSPSVVAVPKTGGGYEITVTPDSDDNSASAVANQINDEESEAKDLVTATVFGVDGPLPTDGQYPADGDYYDLELGENCNGKLVGNQTITRPEGIDPGPGYADADGELVLAHINAHPNYAYAANSNGFYPGFTAYIAKSKTEPNDPFEQGWQNAFGADDKAIKARLLWLYNQVSIEVVNFNVTDDVETRKHNSVWMGLGTDRPQTSLHIRTSLIDEHSDPQTPEIPELRLDKVEQHTDADVLARIAMYGRGNIDTETQAMTEIVGRIIAWNDGEETSRLSFSTMLEGTYATRWHVGAGLWAEGVSGDDKGVRSINVESVHVGGTKVLATDPEADDGARVILGPPADVSIVSGAILFRRTNTTVTATGGGDVIAITGGEEGAWIIIRPGATSGAIVVKNNATGGNIRCGADITLGNARKSVQLLYSGSEWVRFPTD
ncbi:MAG: hypothetical protein H7X93_03520 [Sphingomonadaceae bacterium]|nr:hypothetical protein [Sphingomonadaceae bacterium]